MTNSKDSQHMEKARRWLEGNYDEDTKKEVKRLMDEDTEALADAFYKDLEFGTGGLRGVMGAGTNRMNKYTVGSATQGLANYLKKNFKDKKLVKVAIAYDSRLNNTYFAKITADVLSANGIKVYVFDDIRPTPELSFAIRTLNCQSGIVITASHNPKEYNGYKVYWEDGAQLVAPHDKNVIEEVKKVNNVEDINFNGNPELQETIGEDIDRQYIDRIRGLSLNPEIVIKQKDLKIVYTPLHGTGVELVPRALKSMGFENVMNIPEQDVKDGNFPTVKSPNPEEPAALDMAIKKAKAQDAELVMATDPDADRVGVAVKDSNGEFKLLNGNQTAALLIQYIISQWEKRGLIKGQEYIVKTIVTSEILKDIANNHGVESYDTLTGFKYIAEVIREMEDKKTFIAGGEESYGYLAGDFVRDKDAIISACLIAEATAYAKENGMSLLEQLHEIHLQYGFYKEGLKSVVKKGKAGAEEINAMMEKFRNNPPDKINNSNIIRARDYSKGIELSMDTGNEYQIYFPKSNVLQFFTEDGTKITMRPSGTEPKIKFYIGVKQDIFENDDYPEIDKKLEERINSVIKDLGLE
ncbi:MAG: phospho-sugar mutase [Bacteroidales bacterium]|nr:phospho-sugar mutase [Bacteroidales bacterium]